MDVIQDLLEESYEIYRDIKKNIPMEDKFKSMAFQDRLDLVRNLKSRIQSIYTNIQLAQNELPLLDNINKEKCEQELNTLKNETDQQDQIINKLQMQQQEEARLQDLDDNTINASQLTDMNKVQIASVLYQNAQANLQDGNRMLDEIIVINNEITNTLQQDSEKLNRIDDSLTAITSETQLAKKQIRQLAKRVVSNKCYMAMFALILLIVFGLSIWDLVNTFVK